jgi:hypothetical protein
MRCLRARVTAEAERSGSRRWHRTIALAISPYTRRGYVDSTFYSTQSIGKTIALILGHPAMSLFDLIAEDLRRSFQQQGDTTPYAAVPPAISLFDENPKVQGLAGQARAMRLRPRACASIDRTLRPRGGSTASCGATSAGTRCIRDYATLSSRR